MIEWGNTVGRVVIPALANETASSAWLHFIVHQGGRCEHRNWLDGHFPTAGLTAVFAAVQCCRSVSLFGFHSDEYQQVGVQSRYFDPTSVAAMPVYHDHDREARVLQWFLDHPDDTGVEVAFCA